MSIDVEAGVTSRANREPGDRMGFVFRGLSRRQSILFGLANLVGFFAFWELFTRLRDVDPFVVPPFSALIRASIDMHQAGVLLPNVWSSTWMYTVGMVASVIVGIPLGLAVGGSRLLDRFVTPYLWVFYTTPRIILLPLVMLWVGLGDLTRFTMVFIAAVPPIAVFVLDGVKTVDGSLVTVGRSFCASKYRLYRTIVVPGTVPFIGTGVRMGAVRGLIGLFVAELFTTASGLGYLIIVNSRTFNTAAVLAAVGIYVALSIVIVMGTIRLSAYLDRWRARADLSI